MKKLLKKLLILAVIVIVITSILNKKRIEKNLLKKTYKTEYLEYVEKYANEYNVDRYLIFAVIKAESNFKKDAVSNKGAQGLMQLMYTTAVEISDRIGITVNKENILDPEININLGTKCISILIKKYNNIELALAAYNAGSGKVDDWIKNDILKSDGTNIENIPYKETNNYVRKIVRDYNIYKQIYE